MLWYFCLASLYFGTRSPLLHLALSSVSYVAGPTGEYVWCGRQAISSLASSVQLLSRVWLFATLQTAARQAFLSITNSRSLPKLMSIESVMPSNHLILCHPLLLLPSIFPSISLYKWVGSSHQVAKVLEFQLQHQSFNEYSGLIFFRMVWLDLLAAQGTLKSLIQHYSLKASILWCSAFFIVQLSHPYMITGKTIALTTGPLLPK